MLSLDHWKDSGQSHILKKTVKTNCKIKTQKLWKTIHVIIIQLALNTNNPLACPAGSYGALPHGDNLTGIFIFDIFYVKSFDIKYVILKVI